MRITAADISAYEKQLLRRLKYLTNNKEQAEDCLQNLYLKALVENLVFDPQKSKLLSYLTMIGKQIVFKMLKKQKVAIRLKVLLTEKISSDISQVDTVERRRDANVILNSVERDTFRQILFRQYILGESGKELAADMGYTYGTIREFSRLAKRELSLTRPYKELLTE